MNLKVWGWALPVIFLAAACKKNTDVAGETIKPATGMYVLSEGTFNGNNTRLAYYDFARGTVSGNFFNAVNNSDLGDTGNDMIIYGSKLYVVMNVTGNVTVIEAATGKLLKRIDLKNGALSKQPRRIAAAKGKVYVTAFDDSVSVIDTVNLTITKSIKVGADPEGIAVAGNYLYVANSGGLGAFTVGYDSTVSVIDLTTETEIIRIKVGINPSDIRVSSAGDVYVTIGGNYANIKPGVFVIDGQTNTFKAALDTSLQYSQIKIFNDVAYLYSKYGANPGGCKILDTKTNKIIRDKFITDSTSITSVYGIEIDESNGDVYITDAKDYQTSGEVFCFDTSGKKRFSFSVSPGVSPNTIAFLRR